jgi:hypothetical protein
LSILLLDYTLHIKTSALQLHNPKLRYIMKRVG